MAGRIRIRLKAFDHAVIDQASADIVRTAEKTGARGSGPTPLPPKQSRWPVFRPPPADKKSREQFELKTHKRMIDILDSRAQTVDALTKLDLPAGVDVEIKVGEGEGAAPPPRRPEGGGGGREWSTGPIRTARERPPAGRDFAEVAEELMIGIIGKKVGMTQIFNAQGQQIPCTVVEATPNAVTKVTTGAFHSV